MDVSPYLVLQVVLFFFYRFVPVELSYEADDAAVRLGPSAPVTTDECLPVSSFSVSV